MPPKKESTEEKARRLHAQSNALRLRADYIKICGLLKGREDLISRVKRDLIAAGELVIDSAGDAMVPLQAPCRKAEPSPMKRERPDPDGEVTAALAVAAAASALEDELATNGNHIHRNFSKWITCPPTHVHRILVLCEPVSLNLGNMKPIIRKGSKMPPRHLLLELLEMISDVDPSSNIGEERDIIKISEDIAVANVKNSRRCRDLAFPIDWAIDGIYELNVKHPCLEVRLKATSETCIVSGIVADANSMEEFSIDVNFSKLRAQIVRVGKGFKPINIAVAFARTSAAASSLGAASSSASQVLVASGNGCSRPSMSPEASPSKRGRVENSTDVLVRPAGATPVAPLAFSQPIAAFAPASSLFAAAVVAKVEEQEEQAMPGLALAVGFGDGGAVGLADGGAAMQGLALAVGLGDDGATSHIKQELSQGESDKTAPVVAAVIAVAVGHGMTSSSAEGLFVPPAPAA